MQTSFRPIEYILFIALVVLGSWYALHYLSNTLHQKSSYNALSEELQLKASPDSIIYSEAYRNKNGGTEIKYAYLDDEVPPDEGEDISRRTPVSQTAVLETFVDEEGKDMEKLKTTFMSKPQFYQDSGQWRQIEYATTTEEVFSLSGAKYYVQKREWGERLAGLLFGVKPVFAVTSTFYPDPDVETSSVDGYISETHVDASNFTSWSTARTSATGNLVVDTGTTFIVSTANNFISRSGDWRAIIRRGFLLFDTASLGSGATISAATLSVYPTAKTNEDNSGSDTIGIYTSAPASNTALAAGDYDSITYTAQATAVDITGLATGAYHNFTLNATGLSNIAKTGVTKFSVLDGHDVADLNHVDTTNSVTISSAEETGTTQDPKLEVTYTAAANYSFGQWFPF